MTRLGWLIGGTADLPSHDAWLSEREGAALGSMRLEKRRADFRLGRFTAKRALARWLGVEEAWETLAALEVLAADDGAPEARCGSEPAGASLSLSHRACLAIAAVGPDGLALGCDLELIEPRSEAFVRDFFRPEEVALVHAAPRARQDLVATVIWSLKESALKARREGLRADTRDVETRLCGAQGFGPWQGCTAWLRDGTELHGLWRQLGRTVLTLASSEPAAPQPLVGAQA